MVRQAVGRAFRNTARFAFGLACLSGAGWDRPVAGAATLAARSSISPREIDDLAARTMKTFQVPGMAIGIVKDGKLLFARGYGVRELGKPERVDADTLFQIGSNTKAMTAAALAILVDEGRIGWDDKVIDYLPQFRLYDPYVTREFTVRDLLSHRSGLGLGAGDLMFFPATDFSRGEVIHGLRYLKPVSSFRSRYDYDNLLYIVAGELVSAVAGVTWEDFVARRILAPVGMTGCAPRYDLIADRGNVATPHVEVEGQVRPLPVADMRVVGPAGTVNCSINGMARWVATQLAGGVTPGGVRLFSAERGAEMWSVTTPMTPKPLLAELYDTHFAGYGFGWELSDAHGYKRVHHTGGVPGTVTWVSLIPERKLGVLVFTNQESAAAMEAVGGQITDAFLHVRRRDWVAIAALAAAQGRDAAAAAERAVAAVAGSAGPPALPLAAYAGRYRDPWRGEATIVMREGRLMIDISRTRSLKGQLTFYKGDTFVVRWDDRSLHADAFVRFGQGFDGRPNGFTMRAVSPATDFSFDFQDLDFRRTD